MNRITRRHALTGAATSFMIVKPGAVHGSQANSAVPFGVIGTGNRGSYVATLMVKDPGARLVAICDLFPDRIDLAKTVIPGADNSRVYKDYHELLAQADIDAVLIATPVYLHPEHFEAAAKAGKHIYCEKPAGADVAGVKRLMRAAVNVDKSKSVFFGFQQRFSPEYLAAENILRSGQMGELLLMISYWIYCGSAFKGSPIPRPTTEEQKIRQWGRWKETSGDFIVEQDCHGVDVLNWFAQAHPIKATGNGGRSRRVVGDNSDHALVSYEYPGGLKGWLLGTQLPPFPYGEAKEQFFGTRGVVETSRKNYKWVQSIETRDRAKRKEAASRLGEWDKIVESKGDITTDAVASFFHSILTKKPVNMAESSVESTLTSLLGRMAIELHREVTWEELLGSA